MDHLYLVNPGFLNLGPTEIIIILIIAVLLFGGRLPDVARTLGKGLFDFKRNLKDLQDEVYRQDFNPPRSLPKPYDGEGSEPKKSDPEKDSNKGD